MTGVETGSHDGAVASPRGLGTVTELRRYPVKSMLGEDLHRSPLGAAGLHGDRALALLDLTSGRVATAKHPRLWRTLLRFSAHAEGDAVVITLPDGRSIDAAGADVDRTLSAVLGRPVHLTAHRPAGASVERPAPEDVMTHGEAADVPFELLEIAQGSSGDTFVDYAPVHLITTATLDHVGVEACRYRPNLVIDTPDVAPFAENDWIGREIDIGETRLRAVLPTPRCAVPTLEHGDLPRATHAVRAVLAENRVDVPGFGVLPCAGLYAQVVSAGTLHLGDHVTLR